MYLVILNLCNYFSRTLQAVPNGSGSPCIDLSRISYRLAQQSFDADLVILEVIIFVFSHDAAVCVTATFLVTNCTCISFRAWGVLYTPIMMLNLLAIH